MSGNNLKTVALLAFLTALVVLMAELFGFGFIWGLIIAGALNFAFYFWSARLALGASRARPVEEHELPGVYAIVRRLTLMDEMPMPSIYLIDSPQPNAFATGRSPKHAAVAVTSGIVDMLSTQELEGVLAHELAHVRNRDILISTIAAMLAAALTIFARIAFWTGGGRGRQGNAITAILALASLILAPIAAMIIRLAISRAREYEADHDGAEMTGQPLNLASALEKIGMATQRIPMAVNPAVSPLYIADPLKSVQGRRRAGGFSRLFATHPPIEERIDRLQEMATGVR
ncbi:MAG: zinc metalloprotease HtpX [Acidimicrobiia bacterium]